MRCYIAVLAPDYGGKYWPMFFSVNPGWTRRYRIQFAACTVPSMFRRRALAILKREIAQYRSQGMLVFTGDYLPRNLRKARRQPTTAPCRKGRRPHPKRASA